MPDSLKIIKTDEIVYFGAEQPLPPYGCCNLGSLDLVKFLHGDNLDFVLLEEAVRVGVRTLDKIIDINNYPPPKKIINLLFKDYPILLILFFINF